MTYEEFEKLRDERNMTNYQVAIATGVSKATLSQWKNGNSVPSAKTNKRLESFFSENVDAVYAYTLKDCTTSKNSNYRIESYTVNLNNQVPVELSEPEYAELKIASEAFAYTWLKMHKKI